MQIAIVSIRFVVVFIVMTLLFPFKVMAQEQFSFRQLSVKEGLSQNSVVSITQDSTGYLWLATQDGLNKYDGRQFKTYPFQFTDITRPTFSRLGKIYVDVDGRVFIIPSDHRLYVYDPLKDEFYVVEGIEKVTAIFQDASKRYLIGTMNGEVFRLDQHLKSPPKLLKTGAVGQIKKIGAWPTEGVFVLSEQSLILLQAETLVARKLPLETLIGEAMTTNYSAVAIDDDARLWIGFHGDGVFYYDRASASMRRLNTAQYDGYLPSELTVLDLIFDQQQRLWVTTYGDGLYLIDFETEKITHFSEQKQNPRALHYNDILCAFQDSSGTLWFGTDGAGASFYDSYLEKFNSFTNYQTPSNINIDVVRALTLDAEKNVWIGTSGKGLTKYEPETNSWITYTTANSSISSNRIMSLLYDREGLLWAGTQNGGLSILNKNGDFEVFDRRSEISLGAETIWTIFEDRNKAIWLGTRDNGLLLFDRKKGVIAQYTSFDTEGAVVNRKNIRVLTEDAEGHFWLGTDEEGLVKFDPKTAKASIFTPENSPLSSKGIKSLYYDSNGVLWIGTSGGGLDAFVISTGKFYNYSTNDGLPNNVIYSILPDEAANLWLSSNRGVTKFKVADDFSRAPEITNYDNYDGLATEFNTGAYYKHSDGNLYFGSLEGYYWFDPQSISENQYLPQTVITEYKVLNELKSVHVDTLLKHNANTIDFTFSSLQFSEPGKNQYKYRLLPYEEEWVSSGNKNSVRYTHLPPDDYEFQVVSSNYDGQWNDTPSTLHFSIAAPWYFNTWSKAMYALLLALSIVLTYRYLRWRWKMKLDLQLKQEEADRLKELNTYKSKIYTEIAHEFRTPLTLISGPIEAKLSQPDISEDDIGSFSMIERNATRLTNLVDQLLQLARLEEGRFQLQKDWGAITLFLRSIAASFSYEAQQKDIAFTYQVSSMNQALYDEDALDKITVNLLSNALKYGKQGGKCEFTATHADEVLHLMVSNDVESAITDPQKLFERFYQDDKNASGAGIGLSLVQQLVKLYDGEIEVLQPEGQIRFLIRLPMPTEKETVAAKEKDTSAKVLMTNTHDPIVLVVEDDDDVRAFIGSEFGKYYTIIEAKHGKAGLEKALKNIPDLVISDVRMPIMDGIVLCNTLKSDERTSHIPVILLTASNDKANELRGLKAGADDYVTKPFKLNILKKRVANLVKSRQLLRERYSQEGFLKPKEIAITPTDEVFLTKVQEVLNGHMENSSFNAEEFSKRIGMSRMQLHRKLMAYTGLSTSAFIRSQRLKQAVQILKSSDATINEVAYAVGFNTPSYFIKCFKEAYKKTPSEYLQRAK